LVDRVLYNNQALQRAISSVFDGKKNTSGLLLAPSDIAPCLGSRNTWASYDCTAGMRYKLKDALLSLRSVLMSLDGTGYDLFSAPYAPPATKAAVLLGDKARSMIR
jgi:hypothetical protein